MMRETAAVVVQGHRVASGACGDMRFPDGTIAPQLRWFRRLVPDFDAYLGAPAFSGTINLAVAGSVTIGSPEFRLDAIRWTSIFPPETFFLSRAALLHRGVRRPVFIYVPDPATKPDHHQPPDRIELLCAWVANLSYGDTVVLEYPTAALTIGEVEAPPLAKPGTMR